MKLALTIAACVMSLFVCGFSQVFGYESKRAPRDQWMVSRSTIGLLCCMATQIALILTVAAI